MIATERRKPSEEKVYLKHYPEGAADTPLPKMKVDEYFSVNNTGKPDYISLIHGSTGQKITTAQLISSYNDAAKSLAAIGVKRGENVALSLLNVPELVYMILACSKIGATINMINPTVPPEDIVGRVRSLNPKVLIAQDKTAPVFNKLKDRLNVNSIVTVPIVKGITNFGMKPMDKDTGWWSDFIKLGKNAAAPDVPYDPKAPFMYTHSSGSTGKSKPIELGHDTFTHMAHMNLFAVGRINPGDKGLSTVPAFFSTGVNGGLMIIVLLGITIVLEPNYNNQVFLNNILKYKPRLALATKTFWKGMFDDPRFDGVDMSFIEYPTIGGEKFRRYEARKFNGFLASHNNFFGFSNGYGQCELGGGICSSRAIENKVRDNNTIGIPYSHNTIIIKDFVTGEEVGYGERGAVTAKTSTAMFRYHDMPEKTVEYFKDGVANLGDIGYVNEEGEYFIDGRMSDFINLAGGVKLYPYEVEDVIEDVIETNLGFESVVRDYCVYGKPEGEYEVPAFQVYVDEADLEFAQGMVNEINSVMVYRLPKNKRIAVYKIRTEPFPVSFAGKMDVKKIKTETEGFTLVES